MNLKNPLQPISSRLARTLGTAFLLAVPGLASGPLAGPAGPAPGAPMAAGENAEATAPIADERASYSFLRTLEGDATVAAAGQGVGEALEVNQPLLTGDQVRVGPDSRLELALSDRNRLRLGAETGIVLERLAFSGDREERITVLRLEGGELLLEVSEEALGDELPRIITANATVYIQQPGEYRVESGVEDDGQAWTRVVTRRGYAEIVTDRGSSVVREAEAILALGDRSPRLELAAADAPDELERWGAELSGRVLAGSRSAAYVEPHLAYDAAPLDEAGDWVEYESVRYWRPYVSAGWRPYWQGRWSWTPSGYTWVSNEPWGWVPYHYGLWCSLPGFGWAWRPGAVYSPAWVYWNWTSGWASWVPMGYYSQFYDPWYGGGFRYGVYGWAGGGWGIYSDWNYAPVHCFRDRHFRGHMRTGRDRAHESRLPEPPRGLLTTDTRDFSPDRIDRTDRTEDLLHEIGKRSRERSGRDLADVTDFVGRKGRLPSDVARVVVNQDPKGGRDKGVIRDIGSVPKIAATPSWKRREEPKSGGAAGTPGVKETPVQSTGKGGRDGKEGGSATGGLVSAKPRPATPKGVPPIDSRSSGGKSATPQAVPRGPDAKAYEPKGTSSTGDDRQLWKEKGSESAPVQRVVGSVRRPAPGADSKGSGTQESPTYGKGSSGSQGTQSYGKGSSGSQGTQTYGKSPSGSQGSQSYGKSPSGSQGSQSYGKSPSGSQGSQSYGKSPSGSQGTQTYGKSPSGSQGSQSYGKSPSGSQGSQSYGKSPSTSQGSQNSGRSPSGSQGSQSYGKSPSGSQGSQGAQSSGRSPAASSGSSGNKGAKSGQPSGKSSPPPPPPPKKDDGGHH